MCDDWCKKFVKDNLKYWPESPRVLEVGSYDVNGTVRDDCEPLSKKYIGIDIRSGKGVDKVLNVDDLLKKYKPDSFGVVISTEMLEHTQNWPLAVYNMVMVLESNGLLMLTTRSHGFPKHEEIDHWRFSVENLKAIFEPMGKVLELDTDSEVPGCGIVFKKKSNIDAQFCENWLQALKMYPIFHIDLGVINFVDFDKKRKPKPTIGLCMIVKDEEKVLERAIDSVKSIIDKYFIVDTGSTDKTKEIIAKYGQIYEIPFKNYVDTKNAALKLVDTDYVLFFDADEVMLDRLDLLRQNADAGAEAVYGKVIEENGTLFPDTYFRARLWKNNGKWKFEGPNVHENIEGEGVPVIDHRIQTQHNRLHRTWESYMEKSKGYIKLLSDYLVEHPKDSRALFYLGRTHKDLGNWLEAIMWYRQYMETNTQFRDERFQAVYDSAICWKVQGEYDQALVSIDLAEKIDPRRAEALVLKGEIYMQLQEFEKAVELFEKASSLPIPSDVLLFLNVRMYHEIPLDDLMVAYDKLHKYRESAKVVKQLLDDNKGEPDQRMVNNMNWLNKMKDKIIFMALGNTPEPVFGDIIEKQGVGGVETSYVELSQELVKRGHTVFVFAKCSEDHVYNGVYWVPFEKLTTEYKDWKPDIVISSRWWDAFYLFPSAKKINWSQDAHFADPNHPDAWQIINAYICSSPWHRNYTAERVGLGMDAKKIHVIPLSIRAELFQNKNIKRDPLKAIFSSNPDRGLYQLMEMWDEITKKIDGIHLAVTYGWEGLRTWSNDSTWLAKQDEDENRVRDWAKKAGNVTITGRLTKVKLAEEMLGSSICAYPNNFWETMCLTGLETQVAGVPMITTAIGALNTTLCNESNILINDNPFGESYKRKFIDATVDLMTNKKKLKKYSEKCIEYFSTCPTWSQVAEQWEHVFYNI